MSNKRELQAEIESLKNQLASAKLEASASQRDKAYYRNLSDSQANTINALGKELHTQRDHHVRAMLTATQAMADEASHVIGQIKHEAELRIVAAQRDAIGEALRYTLDNLTLNK